jgi:hypothetical protein
LQHVLVLSAVFFLALFLRLVALEHEVMMARWQNLDEEEEELLRENVAHIVALAGLLVALPRGLNHLVAILYPQ